jgi:GTPase SAR1 family protein
VTNKESFANVKNWIDSIYEHGDSNIVKLLVGNKIDLPDKRIVSTADAQKLAQQHNMKYIETSAKENINVSTALHTIIEDSFELVFKEKLAKHREDTSFSLHPRTPKVELESKAECKC